MRSVRTGTAALAGLAALVSAALVSAPSAAADTAPPAGLPATVSADPLPTAQIDGVVWSQAIVGTKVFAGGNFKTARPAGAAAGTKTVARPYLLSFDLRTGVLLKFAPKLNGQVTAVAASPDGRRIYVGGSFTSVNGVRRYRFAAFDVATGALLSFRPAFNSAVRALTVTRGAVYAGGTFTAVNGLPRARLAAVSTSTGKLTAWAPVASSSVTALVATPDGKGVVVGGRFRTLARVAAKGLGAVDAVTGRARAFAANTVVQDYGPGSSITSLSTDGRLVYGTGYAFGGGNFEGTFAAIPATGRIVWLEDCHGDTYGAAAAAGVVYTVGHAHSCANVGGFPETVPRSWHHSLAFTTAAKGTVAANTEGKYTSFEGQPAPQLLTWWPQLSLGTVTGQSQAAWAVSATSSYVVLGGEFPRVNGKKQQGLVRFAVRKLAPNKVGPYQSGAALGLAAQVQPDGSVQLTWNRTWDRDNESLTYTLQRDGVATPVERSTVASTFWRLGTMTATDPDTTPGSRTYRLTVADPLGNTVTSSQLVVPVTPPAP